MGVGMPDFRERQVENRAKNGKCSISQGFEDGFYHLSQNGKNNPHYTILNQYTLSDLKIEPKKQKKKLFLSKF